VEVAPTGAQLTGQFIDRLRRAAAWTSGEKRSHDRRLASSPVRRKRRASASGRSLTHFARRAAARVALRPTAELDVIVEAGNLVRSMEMQTEEETKRCERRGRTISLILRNLLPLPRAEGGSRRRACRLGSLTSAWSRTAAAAGTRRTSRQMTVTDLPSDALAKREATAAGKTRVRESLQHCSDHTQPRLIWLERFFRTRGKVARAHIAVARKSPIRQGMPKQRDVGVLQIRRDTSPAATR